MEFGFAQAQRLILKCISLRQAPTQEELLRAKEEKIREREREKQEQMREKEESRKRAIEEKRAEREEKARRVKENLKHQEQCRSQDHLARNIMLHTFLEMILNSCRLLSDPPMYPPSRRNRRGPSRRRRRGGPRRRGNSRPRRPSRGPGRRRRGRGRPPRRQRRPRRRSWTSFGRCRRSDWRPTARSSSWDGFLSRSSIHLCSLTSFERAEILAPYVKGKRPLP